MATPRILIFYGEVTSHGRILRRGAIYVTLALAWITFFLVFPSLVIAALGFAQRSEYGAVVWHFTWANYKRLAGFGILGWSPNYLLIFARSLWVGFVTTALAVLMAYPMAFYIASRPRRSRYLWLAFVVIPLCTNMVIRTSAWMLILGGQMPLAGLARHLGWLAKGQALYPGALAVYIGMISTFLPFAVLPLYTSVERIDWSIAEAARDLYASKWRVFQHAILPQTLPGLLTAVILTFIPAVGVFVVPDLLGGSKYMLVGNLIQDQFGPSRDLSFGSAVCMMLILLTLVGLFVLRRTDPKGEGVA